jgi:ethanolamine phosphate transferase 2 subunit G
MILHYLGLDHVGHIEGPFAPINIKRKLHEMDEIVRKIYNRLDVGDILLVLSDHGMANEGGHGGSSHPELETPAVFVSKSMPSMRSENSTTIEIHQQIDLASTLSCLYELAIPENNQGVAFVNSLYRLKPPLITAKSSSFSTLVAIFKCLNQNMKQLSAKIDFSSDDMKSLHEEIAEILSNFIITTRNLNDLNDLKLLNQMTELNINYEHLIRRCQEIINTRNNSDSINELKAFFMMVALICMFIVSKWVFFFRLELII